MISVANRWQSEIRIPPDGQQPSASGFGTVITADVTPHVKGAWTDVVDVADWSGFVGDSLEIEINFNFGNASGAVVRILADIGIDTGGGYASIIDNLSASFPGTWTNGSNGINYKFSLRIPNGAKVGCRAQSNVSSKAFRVAINLFGNPKNPGLVRAGTFVRTFGADTANSQGAAISTGTASDGAWFEMVSATADDLWQWEVGYHNNDAAFATGGIVVDLASGAAASEVKFATNFVLSKNTTEAIGKNVGGFVFDIPSGERIAARMQSQGGETTETLTVHAVGGNYELPDAANATGTVTVSGAPAANGKTVEIYAKDADGVIELIGSTLTAGGAGGFSLGCPDTTRSYFARYVDGATVGSSIEGTPGVTSLDITIGGAGGGDTTPPTVTIISPTPATAPGAPGGFSTDWAVARMTPIVIDITDAAPGLDYACLVCRYPGAVEEIVVYRRGAFRGQFLGLSSTSAIANGLRFSILPLNGWPSSDVLADIVIEVDAIDGDGNIAA